MRVSGTMPPMHGLNIPWIVKCRFKKLVSLDSHMIEDSSKKVFKQTVFSEKGRGSVAILFLQPGAKVKKHKHTSDSEIYIAWNSKKKFLKVEMCNQNEEHELENVSKKRWSWVIAIKHDIT